MANPYLLVPSPSPMIVIAACYVVVASGLVLAVWGRIQLQSRLVALWALAVITLGVLLAPSGAELALVGFALLYGTIAVLLWMAPPLVVVTLATTFRCAPSPTSGPAAHPPSSS